MSLKGYIELIRLVIRTCLFSVRDPLAGGIYSGFLLPPPRTILSLLARALLESNGVKPEEPLKGNRAADITMWAVECGSIGVCRLFSPLTKKAVTWRIRPLIEIPDIGSKLREVDVVSLDTSFTCDIYLYYLVIWDEVVNRLEKYLDSVKVGLDEIKASLMGCDRIGSTESMISVIDIGSLKWTPIGSEGEINTYVPADWLRSKVEGIYLMLPYTILIGNYLNDNVCSRLMHGFNSREFKYSRMGDKKAMFLVPLKKFRERRFTLYKEESVVIRVKEKFAVVRCHDGCGLVAPKSWIE